MATVHIQAESDRRNKIAALCRDAVRLDLAKRFIAMPTFTISDARLYRDAKSSLQAAHKARVDALHALQSAEAELKSRQFRGTSLEEKSGDYFSSADANKHLPAARAYVTAQEQNIASCRERL